MNRGRDAHYWAPPAQIRTGPIKAYGSYLGWVTVRRAAATNRFLALPTQSTVCEPAPVSRVPGTVPGACFAGSHSPRSPPLAPPAPQRMAPLCSSASQLLWRSLTSHVRASSATAPRLPDADRRGRATSARRETSRFPYKELPHMPGSLTAPSGAGARADAPVPVAFRSSHGVGCSG